MLRSLGAARAGKAKLSTDSLVSGKFLLVPPRAVTGANEEDQWKRAKAIAAEQGNAESWPLIMHIYQQIKGAGGRGQSEMPKVKKSFNFTNNGVEPGYGEAAHVRPRLYETKWVGQVPGINTPMRQGMVLDPEINKLMKQRPKDWSTERFFKKNIMSAKAVVDGLGLSPTSAQVLERFVHQEVVTSSHVGELKKALLSKLLTERYDPMIRKIVVERSAQWWQTMQKGDQHIVTIDDLYKAKFETTGGKYHKRVSKKDDKGKTSHKYYYDEKKYEAEHGSHSSGEENRKTHLSKTTFDMACKAGEKGCAIADYTDLVKEYGSKPVHDALKEHTNGGKLSYKSGKFYNAPKDRKTEPPEKKKNGQKKFDRKSIFDSMSAHAKGSKGTKTKFVVEINE